MSMYETGVSMRMVSRHRLPDASPGEREEHAHDYLVEVIARGSGVDDMGYLVDIGALKEALSSILDLYRGRCMNEISDFSVLVPSLENLARAIWVRLSRTLDAPLVDQLTIKIWEDDEAWASYGQGTGR
jgi:6-pyruvoyltetrahydropterin/6-carboxytetrahydropterin synthase